MALITFDDEGQVENVLRFGTERFGEEVCAAVEVSPAMWHTVIALRKDSVLLEVKAGPFKPDQPKDLAPSEPEKGSSDAHDYLCMLRTCANNCSRAFGIIL